MYWWVNHKQTFKQEIDDGYIWSPKCKKNGQRNYSYDNLPRTQVGDIVFSYANAKLQAIGSVTQTCQTAPKPDFGSSGSQWSDEGWLVSIRWQRLSNPLRPKDFLQDLAPHFPSKYSPLQANGNGNQCCYLAEISNSFARQLLSLCLKHEWDYTRRSDIDRLFRDLDIESINSSSESETTKQQLIDARRGHGTYRRQLERVEQGCRVTGVSEPRYLIASHIKPWAVADNKERLDPYNGLLLSPHVDILFNNGDISFSCKGEMLLAAPERLKPILQKWHIKYPCNIGQLHPKQLKYLNFHREFVFKKTRKNEQE